ARGSPARDRGLRAGFGLQLQRLVLEILLEPGTAQLAPAARLLVAAERRLHVEGAAVDVDLPGAQPPRDALGALLVLRPHAAGEAVDRVVRDAHGVVLVPVGDDREHRAEDLLLRDRRARIDAAEHGRPDEPAARDALGPLGAAREQLRALGDALGDVAAHALELRLRGEGPEPRVAEGIADGEAPRGLDREARGLLVAALGDEQPRVRAAGLAGVEEARVDRALHRLREVGVLEHDRRGLAAELERHALHVLRAELGDALAGAHRAGEGDHVDLGMARDRLAHDRA